MFYFCNTRMATILVTGANGQLGQCFRSIAPLYAHDFLFADKTSLNIKSTESIFDYLNKNKDINYIVNCAAYTAVDLAETEREQAFELNSEGVKNIAKACVERDIALIHISTDYVFDGQANKPYSENDSTRPQGAYGASKLAGENELLQHCSNAIIIRTSWLYSAFGKNFVKTIIEKAKSIGELNVVNDQYGNPTYAMDLAECCIKIIDKKISFRSLQNRIFHFSNTGNITWFDFANAICSLSNIACTINAVSSSAFKTAAKRPSYSVFDTSNIAKTFDIEIKDWKTQLIKCLLMIKKASK